jgi:hypothetical protein
VFLLFIVKILTLVLKAAFYFDVLGFIRRNELGGFSGIISWKCHSFILSGEADMGTTGKQPEWEYPD